MFVCVCPVGIIVLCGVGFRLKVSVVIIKCSIFSEIWCFLLSFNITIYIHLYTGIIIVISIILNEFNHLSHIVLAVVFNLDVLFTG